MTQVTRNLGKQRNKEGETTSKTFQIRLLWKHDIIHQQKTG